MREGIAFFDIDHTLISRSSGVCFLLEATQRRLVPPSFLFAIPHLYIKYLFFDLHWENWDRPIPGIASISRGAITETAEAAHRNRCSKVLFPQMRDRIARLKGEGIPVWFASSSVDLFVKPLADQLKVDGIVASELEFRDGLSTGRFSGRPAFGVEKLRRVREVADRLSVSLADCSFFSDSIHDLPLLEAVGNPVAVNPDFRLSRVARKRGWEILRC